MRVYTCSLCGFVYDEAKGSPEDGIAQGTLWNRLPEDWECPLCGAAKHEFDEGGDEIETVRTFSVVSDTLPEAKSALEKSILCSNLARGLEKQYKAEEAALFARLADFFKAQSEPADAPAFAALLEQVDLDIRENLVLANDAAAEAKDRGAKRALVWAEKVTKIQKSILGRYENEGDSLIEDKEVHVCSICGFIYIGNALPDRCPICKVPNWKFDLIKAG